MFQVEDGLEAFGLLRGEKPSVLGLTALQTFFDALTWSEKVAFPVTHPDVPAWLQLASEHVVPLRMRVDAAAQELERLAPQFAYVGQKGIRERARTLYPEYSASHPCVSFSFDSLMLRYLEAVLNAVPTRGPVTRYRNPEMAAACDFADLAISRRICVETGLTLWAVLESVPAHLCFTEPLGTTALHQLEGEIAQLRQTLLSGDPPGFQSSGSDLHCNVRLHPVLLALARESKERSDLVRIALQFRSEAAPVRKHLAQLNRDLGNDLLGLVDWRYELQSICDAVGRALGLRTSRSSSNFGSVVMQCQRGIPVELVAALAERSPAGMHRHLFHPFYLTRKHAFIRDLVYSAVLARDAERKLASLFA
jgi:hypothetical protein